MTTIAIKSVNPATKQARVIARYKATHARKHGRPGNVGKIMKVRVLKADD